MPDRSSTDNTQNEHDQELAYLARKTAEGELRESDATKKQCLKQFRDWIRQNADIENCITDDNFLLRFLRAKKYSLPMAQQNLLKYLNFRKIFKYICYDMDYMDPKVQQLTDRGFLFASPYRDSGGRRVVITIPQKIDPYEFTTTDVVRTAIIAVETLLEDEVNQILGFSYVGDAKGMTAAHVSMWNITEFATLTKWGEQSFPVRHKAFHFANLPSSIRYVLDFAMTRVTPKLKKRMTLHQTQSDLHGSIDPAVLPREYGGSMPMSEMIASWKRELATKRDRLLSFDNMHLLSDQGIVGRSTRIVTNEIVGLQGSFRRLEVD